MYHPDGNEEAEYIELLNISDDDVTLYDFQRDAPWRLVDDPDNPTVELFFGAEYPITLEAGRYLLIVKDLALFRAQHPGRLPSVMLEWGAGALDNTGATIVLSRPGDVDDGNRQWSTVDAVTYSDGLHPDRFDGAVDPWPVEANGQGLSLTRIVSAGYGSDPGNWQAATPTPGTVNSR
jgi:hypothetical protein